MIKAGGVLGEAFNLAYGLLHCRLLPFYLPCARHSVHFLHLKKKIVLIVKTALKIVPPIILSHNYLHSRTSSMYNHIDYLLKCHKKLCFSRSSPSSLLGPPLLCSVPDIYSHHGKGQILWQADEHLDWHA